MKYHIELQSVANCPPQACTAKNQEAYRFVYDPLNSSSFLPQGVKNPKRAHDEKSAPKKCSFYALSMYTTETKALKQYKNLKKFAKNIDKTIGTHLAKGYITINDGVMSKPNKKGHFDIFEYKNTDFTNCFKSYIDLRNI